MRPSEIKVGELKKSKKFQTHAAKSCGMSRGFRDRQCCGLPLLSGQDSVSSPVEQGQDYPLPSQRLTSHNLPETPDMGPGM